MQGKITLITPPDIFENESKSILFLHLDEDDQELVSKWLAKCEYKGNLNIYFYDNEMNVQWLLHAFARCEYRFINADRPTGDTNLLLGYLLGKRDTFYKCKNENEVAVFQYINQNRITNIETFLERAINA